MMQQFHDKGRRCGNHMVAVLSLLLVATTSEASGETKGYVGGKVCSSCHEVQATAWQGSHHDLAMMEATETSVRGDFDSARLVHFDFETLFFRQDDRFMVRTDGPDGKLHDYAVKYTFGIYPLQQYLVEFPGGRLQALDIAWDSRPAEQGGQRWFALHPEEKITFDDVLHWTGPNLNWNYMCADCHSTNMHKNYDAESASYQSTWSEIDVSCEACHGPGEEHVQWSEQQEPGHSEAAENMGLRVRFNERDSISWPTDPTTGKPRRSAPKNTSIEIEVCARCHSRRGQISDDWIPGQAFMDAYRPALLSEGLYHSDGQIDDEVYVWGSFLQSKMYRSGVTCSDCHDPHSGSLKLPGDMVCAQCHIPDQYANKAHHFHEPDSTGSNCVQCHMPAKVYMGVDARNDHSMRVPRPDLSQSIGTPNACTHCHTDQTSAWAATQVRAWYGHNATGSQQFAKALNAAWGLRPEARQLLQALAVDQSQPTIARATAFMNFDINTDRRAVELMNQALATGAPLEQLGALSALSSLPADVRVMAFPVLSSESKAIRIEAARLLVDIPAGDLPAEQKAILDKGIAEYIEVQEFNSERPESQVNLGGIYTDLGRFEEAEKAYRTALRLQPRFEPGYVNLAMLLSSAQKEQEASETLAAGLKINPGSAVLNHAMGLALARQQQLESAMLYLANAAKTAPEEARFSYVYAIALNSSGQGDLALQELTLAHKRHPGNVEILFALVTINRDAGNTTVAREYALKLKALVPNEPSVDQLLRSL